MISFFRKFWREIDDDPFAILLLLIFALLIFALLVLGGVGLWLVFA